jgi:phosphate transport system permease protein
VKRDFTKRRSRPFERGIEFLLMAAAAAAIAIVVGILIVVLSESAKFFAQVSILEFVTETRWTPLFEDAHYGIAPLLTGTFMSTLVALAVAVPLGLLAAIYLSEFADARAREIIKPVLELLAGVPTVVYGYFALLFVTPILQRWRRSSAEHWISRPRRSTSSSTTKTQRSKPTSTPWPRPGSPRGATRRRTTGTALVIR